MRISACSTAFVLFCFVFREGEKNLVYFVACSGLFIFCVQRLRTAMRVTGGCSVDDKE